MTWEGLCWVIKTLCTQNEANAFSFLRIGFKNICATFRQYPRLNLCKMSMMCVVKFLRYFITLIHSPDMIVRFRSYQMMWELWFYSILCFHEIKLACNVPETKGFFFSTVLPDIASPRHILCQSEVHCRDTQQLRLCQRQFMYLGLIIRPRVESSDTVW
jgi:hypothetical protein